MSHVTIHAVSEPRYEAFQKRFAEHHDITFSKGKDGTVAVAGRGVHGTLRRDGKSGDVTLSVSAHPALVSTGYIVGLVYDNLTATHPEPAA